MHDFHDVLESAIFHVYVVSIVHIHDHAYNASTYDKNYFHASKSQATSVTNPGLWLVQSKCVLEMFYTYHVLRVFSLFHQ